VDRARAIGLLSLILSKVPKGDSNTPLRVSRDSRMILNWDSLHWFGDIVLYDPECRESANFSGSRDIGYWASSYECPADWPLEKTRAYFVLPTVKSEFSVVDLGMSFIIY
jgi:hypothetical protein